MERKDVVSGLRVASVVLDNLPELPGYNGSNLIIDDTEAERLVKSIDAALAEFDRLHTIIGDIQNYAHKTEDVIRWCDEALKDA